MSATAARVCRCISFTACTRAEISDLTGLAINTAAHDHPAKAKLEFLGKALLQQNSVAANPRPSDQYVHDGGVMAGGRDENEAMPDRFLEAHPCQVECDSSGVEYAASDQQ